MKSIAKPFLMYYIGISGSGKTTIASLVGKKLNASGIDRVQFIDGDDIRAQFGDIFGYTREERMKCNRAVRVVCKYLIENGVSVMLAQVGSYREMRDKVREVYTDGYIEVYIKCSKDECMQRDPKGYYAMLKNGKIQNLNGSNDDFEIPSDSDIVIDTEFTSAEYASDEILRYLQRNGYVI